MNQMTAGNYFPYELELVKQLLPQELQDMGADHMQTLVNIAEVWHLEELGNDYEPEEIDVYVEEQEDPILTFEDGEMSCNLEEFIPEKFSVLAIEVDSVLRYVQIRGKEVFNRMGLMDLPPLLMFID